MRKIYFCIFILSLFIGLPGYAAAETFFIDPEMDLSGRSEIEAELKISGTKNQIYAEKEFFDNLAVQDQERLLGIITNLSKEFDLNIYPKLREVFGEERSPGIDNDPKIFILMHSTKQGIGGYVRDRDAYSKNQFADSNTRELIYLDIDQAFNSPLGPAFLAHEFQHLITFNQKTIIKGVTEERWLNEARSEYAPTILGYNNTWSGSYLQKRTNEFLAHPSDAIMDWRGRSKDHASVNLFIHFLVDKYGVPILKEMTGSDATGGESIERAIAKLGGTETLRGVFIDWAVTAYVNNATLNHGSRFQYKNPNLSFGNLHVLPSSTFRIYDNNLTGMNLLIDNWSAQWHRFTPGSLGEETTLHIRINSKDADSLIVPYVTNDFFGGTTVNFFDLSKGSVLSIPDFGTVVSSVVVIPTLILPGEQNQSISSAFSLEGFISNTFAERFAEGALVRAEGDPRVYIIKNGLNPTATFIRWIQTPELFGFYKHFKWTDIIQVKPVFLSDFEESFLIRRAGDYRIFKVDSSGKKEWLNITAEQFEGAGYKWEMVYEVNDAEFNWYK